MVRRIDSEEAAEIRRKYAKNDVTMTELGKEHGITRSAVGYIVRGQTHKDAGGPILDVHGNAKITKEQVREIRERVRRGERQDLIAEEFELHPTTIHKIMEYETWKDV